jgi:hypothetical protein
MSKTYPGPVPTGFWYCPLKQHRLAAVVCGKTQAGCRARCSTAGAKRGVCPHLDSDTATHAWTEYQAPAGQRLLQLQT